MIAVGVRRVVLARESVCERVFVFLARGELDKLEGPKYAARRAELGCPQGPKKERKNNRRPSLAALRVPELRRKVGEAARARGWQAAAASQDEADESDATEAAGGRTTRPEWDDREVA